MRSDLKYENDMSLWAQELCFTNSFSIFFIFSNKISLYLRLCQPHLKTIKMIRAISNAVLPCSEEKKEN